MATSSSIDLSLPLDQLPDPLPLPTAALSTPDDTHTLRPPGSKSLTNRLLLLAALADGPSTLRRPLIDADDAQRMLAAIQTLGARVEQTSDDLTIHGVAGQWRPASPETTLDLNNAGTATRFLAAAAILSPHPVVITGNARMRERPIAQLTDALRSLGVHVAHLDQNDCPPIQVAPPKDLAQLAASITLPTTTSSQFVSALMLIAPWLPNGLTIRLEGHITSRPYIAMSADLLGRLGAVVHTTETLDVIKIAPGLDPDASTMPGVLPDHGVPAFTIDVEPDASGATYFWAAGALKPNSTVRVEGLDHTSLQGDTHFPSRLQAMGAAVHHSEETPHDQETQTAAWIEVTGPERLSPIDTDLSDMPDAAMTLAACCAFAEGPSTLRGLGTLRVKETDRIAAMVNELTKLGLTVENPVPADESHAFDDPDAIRITPPPGGVDCSQSAPPVHFDTYDDHRMAMSLALIALRRPNVFINDPTCVAKTYPTFWADFSRLF